MNGDNFEETYKIYSREAYGSDQWLYGQGAHSKEIMRLLADGQSYSVLGCADKEDMEKQKKNILTKQYENAESIDISSYKYCTKQDICAFVDECVTAIPKILCM